MNKEIKLTGKEMRKALKDIRKAEKNGFMFCEAIFSTRRGENDHWIEGEYVELTEKAHPTDASLDWGRGQDVSKRNYFIDGKLVPTAETKGEAIVGGNLVE